MPKEKFKYIFLHHSNLEYGNTLSINQSHIKRKFKLIGYHEVVNSGYPTKSWYDSKILIPHLEGSVEIGRPVNVGSIFDEFEQGAHVRGWNKNSYGVCMIGRNSFSNKVRNRTLNIFQFRIKQFGMLIEEGVLGHYEKDNRKICPNIDMIEFRKMLKDNKNYGTKVISIPVKKKQVIKKEINLGKMILKFFKAVFIKRR